VVARGEPTSVEGLPAGLLLDGLVSVVAQDRAKTVIATAGSRRREFIVLRDERVVLWDHLGPGSAEELCLILASGAAQGDLGLQIDDLTLGTDNTRVQVTVKLVGEDSNREATYPVDIGPTDKTAVTAALRGLTPEWSGVRPSVPESFRAETLDSMVPAMKGEPEVWLEMKVESLAPE
jgi:hypothetical protein